MNAVFSDKKPLKILKRFTSIVACGFFLAPPALAAPIRGRPYALSEKGCKRVDMFREGDETWEKFRCLDIGGYEVYITGNDERQEIELHYAGKPQYLNFFHNVTDKYDRLGEKAEWRMSGGKPLALIVSMFVRQEDHGKDEHEVLIVTKMDPVKSCAVTVIPVTDRKAAMNTARAAADEAQSQKCLW